MGDSSSRRNFISNCIGILRATSGRGLIVSSEASSVLGVRAPADVLNLLSVWGLSKDRGLESLDVNPRGVVMNEGLKRSGFRGVIDIVDGGDKPISKEKPVTSKPDKLTTAKDKTQIKNQNQNQNQNKRKVPSEGEPQTISKRAAKRARLAALREGGSTSETPSPAADKENTSASEIETPSKLNAANG